MSDQNYATAKQLLDFDPKPYGKDIDIPLALGKLRVRVEGIEKYSERQAIYDEIARLGNAVPNITHGGEVYKPEPQDILAACWAAKCVAQPQMGVVEWLKFARKGSSGLQLIYQWCLVCSRILPDPDDPQDELPGIAAAKKEIEEDPLAPGGGATV